VRHLNKLKWICHPALIFLLGIESGCRQEKTESNHVFEKPQIVNSPKLHSIGNIQFAFNLRSRDTAYSAQQEIILNVEVRNTGNQDASIPVLAGHPSTWVLKNLDKQTETIKEFKPALRLPWDKLSDHRIATVPSQWNHTYPLLLQQYLGPIPPGRYSLRYRIDSSEFALESEWLDFQVASTKITEVSLVASNQGIADFLGLAWKDHGVDPPRAFFKRTYTRRNREPFPVTILLGNCGPNSTPIPSMTSGEFASRTNGIGWISGDSLVLSRLGGHDSIESSSFRLPDGSAWKLVPFLITPNQNPGDLSIVGAVLGHDGNGPVVMGFRSPGKTSNHWTAPSRLSGPAPLAIRLVPIGSRECILIMAISNGLELNVKAIPWVFSGDLGEQVELGTLPIPEGKFSAFDALVHGENLKWGALAISATGKENGAALTLWTRSTGKASPKMGREKPGRFDFKSIEGMDRAVFKFDSEGHPWILQNNEQGLLIQSTGWKRPTFVTGSEGSIMSDLYFRKGTLPMALVYHENRGFESKSIRFPDGGTSEPDIVEDNE
jgi:hypothetical protein